MDRVELGTLQMTMAVKNGEMLYGFPRLDILQDNLKESIPLVPDGEYQWRLTMTLENAIKVSPTTTEKE